MIMPGIYDRSVMSNERYHADRDYLSSSGVKLLHESPAHFYARYIAPNAPAPKDKPAFTIGTATHAAILEPDVFDSQFRREPKVDKRTKAGKAAAEAFAAEADGKTILTADDYDLVVQMRDMVNDNPLASQIVHDAMTEQSFFYRTDDEIGEKCRTDVFKPEVIADVKTCQSALPYKFQRDALEYNYYLQGAWYLDVVHGITGDRPAVFAFIAVETTPPHPINVFIMKPGDDLYRYGKQQYIQALDRYRRARDNNHWHELLTPELPEWAKQQIALEDYA